MACDHELFGRAVCRTSADAMRDPWSEAPHEKSHGATHRTVALHPLVARGALVRRRHVRRPLPAPLSDRRAADDRVPASAGTCRMRPVTSHPPRRCRTIRRAITPRRPAVRPSSRRAHVRCSLNPRSICRRTRHRAVRWRLTRKHVLNQRLAPAFRSAARPVRTRRPALRDEPHRAPPPLRRRHDRCARARARRGPLGPRTGSSLHRT